VKTNTEIDRIAQEAKEAIDRIIQTKGITLVCYNGYTVSVRYEQGSIVDGRYKEKYVWEVELDNVPF